MVALDQTNPSPENYYRLYIQRWKSGKNTAKSTRPRRVIGQAAQTMNSFGICGKRHVCMTACAVNA
jgi:hypothetical protein